MKEETIISIAFIIALGALTVSLFVNSARSCDVYIQYDAVIGTGINVTGASIAEVKLACYQLCAKELRFDSSIMRDCMQKCEDLQ